MKRDTEHAAWAAGLFEGEGYLYLRDDSNRVEVGIEMCDEDIVRRFHEVVGVGAVTSRHTKGQDAYRWRTTARWDVAEVLTALRPFLGARRGKKADEAIKRVRGQMK